MSSAKNRAITFEFAIVGFVINTYSNTHNFLENQDNYSEHFGNRVAFKGEFELYTFPLQMC